MLPTRALVLFEFPQRFDDEGSLAVQDDAALQGELLEGGDGLVVLLVDADVALARARHCPSPVRKTRKMHFSRSVLPRPGTDHATTCQLLPRGGAVVHAAN